MTHIQWIFSGIGTTLLITIISWLVARRRKRRLNQAGSITDVSDSTLTNSNIATGGATQTAINTVNIYSTDPRPNTTDDAPRTTPRTKVEVPILFIDDKKFEIVDYIKKRGWTETKRIRDLKNLDDPEVIKAKIIFVDIMGVGIQLDLRGEGLELAVLLKQRYPHKKVVLYSSESKHDIFARDIDILDAKIPKNAEPINFLKLIEQFMAQL